MSEPARLSIAIWSDVMCPWCVIGYKALEQALQDLDGEIAADICWKPFELNRDMPPEGEDMASHMLRKYGTRPDPAALGRMAKIAAHAGYEMRYLGGEPGPERRIWNTFAAHVLLAWALETAGPEAQTRLKLALFDAHFQQRRNVSDPDVLIAIAVETGLDGERAAAALADESLARQVREEQDRGLDLGITAVPMMVVNGGFMIPGAQERARYADVLRRVAERLG